MINAGPKNNFTPKTNMGFTQIMLQELIQKEILIEPQGLAPKPF